MKHDVSSVLSTEDATVEIRLSDTMVGNSYASSRARRVQERDQRNVPSSTLTVPIVAVTCILMGAISHLSCGIIGNRVVPLYFLFRFTSLIDFTISTLLIVFIGRSMLFPEQVDAPTEETLFSTSRLCPCLAAFGVR